MDKTQNDSGKIEESEEAGRIHASDYNSLVFAARDGQKGLSGSAEHALKIANDASNPNRTYGGRPLIEFIAEELKKDESKPANVKYNENGRVSRIEIKPDVTSKHLPNFVIDIESKTANGKDAATLREESHKQALQYIEESVNSPARPIPEFIDDQRPLNVQEKTLLLEVEKAALNGDVQALIKMYQADPNNEELWSRLSTETSQDLGYPPVFEFRRMESGAVDENGNPKQDGAPYLVINNREANFRETWDATVVFATGEAKVLKYDSWDKIQFDQPSGRTVAEAAAKTQESRLEGIREQLSLKRCDFDQWERKGDEQVGVASVKELVQRYNSHKDHPCEGDGDEEH